MGQFSVEKPVAPGSALSGNQHGAVIDGAAPTIEARPDEIAEVVAEIEVAGAAAAAGGRGAKPRKSYIAQLRDIAGRQQKLTQSSVFDGLPFEDLCGPEEPLNIEKFKSALWGVADGWLAAEGNWMMVCRICANEAMRNGGGQAPLRAGFMGSAGRALARCRRL